MVEAVENANEVTDKNDDAQIQELQEEEKVEV